MALNTMRITAALNAYPWTRGMLTHRNNAAADYCAVGLLLRYAGVPQSEIECAHDSVTVWERYGELLNSEYGISAFVTVRDIIFANDSAATHEEAIEQVQFVLDGGDLVERSLARRAAAVEALAAARCDPEDDADGRGALLV